MLHVAQTSVAVLGLVCLGYMLALNANYTLFLVLGWREVSDYVRRRPLRDYELVAASPLSSAVSLLVPAHNEERVIVESVRSLLQLEYPTFEVVVVNDGSTDETLAILDRAFDLVPVERVPRARLRTKAVRAAYVSAHEPRLVVVDKEQGGKADALNAALCYARYPLFLAVDSDTVLEPDALSRLVWHFQAQPETVAVGGMVRIANGSTVVDSRIADVRTPRKLLVNLQIMEYLRAFLTGRTGWNRLGILLIISGALGLFRRDVVLDAGGYDARTVGEDAELVFRLHRHCRDEGRPYRVAFVPDPVCWTEAPAGLRSLTRQRDRWQRGLVQALWHHRGVVGRTAYGRIGLVGTPLLVLFDVVGPFLELLAYPTMVVGLVAGWVQPVVAAAFFGVALSYGLALSFGALLLEERAFQRYRRWRCLARLTLASLAENAGYRQYMVAVRVRATLRAASTSHWGEMVRDGFERGPAEPGVAASPVPSSTAS
jgi:cellulose synthase/poly-beta-1,6-N-acetylglucosamine synthase-like glycosyltransferase